MSVLVAEAVHGSVLEDGSLPHGISYRSKHGANHKCWAIWLRRIDDGHDIGVEVTKAGRGEAIKGPSRNTPLKAAAEALGLCIF